jgi:hypothetical protein
MITFTTIYLIVLFVLLLIWMYSTYQFNRADVVAEIRTGWIVTRQYSRLKKYTWEYMLKPNKHNWCI